MAMKFSGGTEFSTGCTELAAFTMGFLPMLALFFTCQKWVSRSVIAGSLKG